MTSRRLVEGVGINDADYVVSTVTVVSRDPVTGKRKQKRIWVCPYYSVWRGMLTRCYSSREQRRSPAYKDCSACEDWLTFSTFKAWMEKQDWKDKQLDKDLLVRGNKVYCPEACCFIPVKVNSFILECTASRGQWPIGVYWNKRDQKFVSRCSNPFTGKYESLGHFDSPEYAHKAWLCRKLELAHLLAKTETDERISQAIIKRYTDFDWRGNDTD